MNEKASVRVLRSYSDKIKSKIQNRKWAGIVALVVSLAAAGARAEAQQLKKARGLAFSFPARNLPLP